MKHIISAFVFLLLLHLSAAVRAAIRLPAVVSDNMVIQQNSNIKIWGWATGESQIIIRVSWDLQKQYTAVVDSNDKWIVPVTTPNAGGLYHNHSIPNRTAYVKQYPGWRSMGLQRTIQHGDVIQRIYLTTCLWQQ